MAIIIGGDRTEILSKYKSPSKFDDLKNLRFRLSKTIVTDIEVMNALKENQKQICEVGPNSMSCETVTQHLKDAKNSKNLNSPIEMVDKSILNTFVKSNGKDTILDVYVTKSKFKETPIQAQSLIKKGYNNNNDKHQILDYISEKVEKHEVKNGDINITKNISTNEDINKMASIINDECDTEECVLASVVKTDEQTNSPILRIKRKLKPEGPRESSEWLSNNDTDHLMKDMEIDFAEFFAFHTTMTDFAKGGDSYLNNSASRRLSNSKEIINRELDHDKTCFGCIINTDSTNNCKNGKCGTHWVCIFVDCRRNQDAPWTIEYFDSVGDPPSDEICKWQEDLKRSLEQYRINKKHNGGIICEANNVQHQKDNNECGVYCSYFIRARIEGIPFCRFLNRILPDHVMNQYRLSLFSK